MQIAMIGQKGIPASYGGVERHVYDLSVHLAREHYDVTVYGRSWYTKKHGYSVVEGVHLVHLPSIHTKHLDTITHTFLATMHALFKRFDVIHYHGVGPALLSWMPRIFSPNTTVITTFHSIDRYHAKWNWFARLVLHVGEWSATTFAHKTIVVSQSLQQYCTNEFHKDTLYIPNAVSPLPRPLHTEMLNEFGLQKDTYMVMVSRLVPHKGTHLLIEAFSNLKTKHTDDPIISNLKLAIVGGAVFTDKYVAELHKQAAKCNDIVFTDFQSGTALNQLYAHALALIHPSLNEGLPITVLEAMALGKSVLVSNIPEHMELIHDPRVVFMQNDVSAIEQAMYDFLQLSQKERDDIGQKNQTLLTSRYDWKVVLPKIIALYESRIKTSKHSTPVRTPIS